MPIEQRCGRIRRLVRKANPAAERRAGLDLRRRPCPCHWLRAVHAPRLAIVQRDGQGVRGHGSFARASIDRHNRNADSLQIGRQAVEKHGRVRHAVNQRRLERSLARAPGHGRRKIVVRGHLMHPKGLDGTHRPLRIVRRRHRALCDVEPWKRNREPCGKRLYVVGHDVDALVSLVEHQVHPKRVRRAGALEIGRPKTRRSKRVRPLLERRRLRAQGVRGIQVPKTVNLTGVRSSEIGIALGRARIDRAADRAAHVSIAEHVEIGRSIRRSIDRLSIGSAVASVRSKRIDTGILAAATTRSNECRDQYGRQTVGRVKTSHGRIRRLDARTVCVSRTNCPARRRCGSAEEDANARTPAVSPAGRAACALGSLPE